MAQKKWKRDKKRIPQKKMRFYIFLSLNALAVLRLKFDIAIWSMVCVFVIDFARELPTLMRRQSQF